MPRLLVSEKGLENTLRNRRWLALVELFAADPGLPQEECEELAWKVIRTIEGTR